MQIRNGYLCINAFDTQRVGDNAKQPKKITGHSFVGLIGKDPFKPKGDYLLDLFRVLPSEKIDPYWLERGDIAEDLIQKRYTKDGHKYQKWNKQEIKYDNFQNIQNFGGLVDGLIDDYIINEVKSKSLKDYDNIVKYGRENEELQGMYYATLWGLDTLFMDWVFFTEEQEKELRETHQITNWQGMKRFSKQFSVDRKYIMGLMKQALDYYNYCLGCGMIPLEDLSDTALQRLVKEKGLKLDGTDNNSNR